MTLQRYPGYTWSSFHREPVQVQLTLMAIAAAQGEIQAEEAKRYGS